MDRVVPGSGLQAGGLASLLPHPHRADQQQDLNLTVGWFPSLNSGLVPWMRVMGWWLSLAVPHSGAVRASGQALPSVQLLCLCVHVCGACAAAAGSSAPAPRAAPHPAEALASAALGFQASTALVKPFIPPLWAVWHPQDEQSSQETKYEMS